MHVVTHADTNCKYTTVKEMENKSKSMRCCGDCVHHRKKLGRSETEKSTLVYSEKLMSGSVKLTGLKSVGAVV